MKLIITILLSVFSLCSFAQQNNNALAKEDILGRWESFPYSLSEEQSADREPLHIYYFKDSTVFHRGEIKGDAVIFNVTGRYSIMGDSIRMVYQDYLNQTQSTRKTYRQIFRVFYKSEERLDVDILDSKRNPLTLIKLENAE